MDFLESLYSIENFGIYLFVIIGILVLLFLIVLFFGKKDQKKRKELEEKLEQTKVSSQDSFAEVTPVTPVEVPEQKVEEEKNMDSISVNNENVQEVSATSNDVLNSDLPSVSSETEEGNEEPKKEFDFDALADAINKELADMEKNMQEKNVEEVKKNDFKPIDLPQQITEPVHLQVEEKPEISKEVYVEPKQKPVMPSVFSSVYVNREKEEPKVQESKPIAPARPEIELPKKMDLPKKSGNSEEKPILEEEKDDIIFR